MILDLQIKSLTDKFKTFESNLNRLEGQRQVLSSQIDEAKSMLSQLENTEKIDLKAIAVLDLVEKANRIKIQTAFETTVTYALQAVYQDNYQFKLEFGTRGNLNELDFKLKSPINKEALELKECAAGGSIDIISIALRFVLIQILKCPGFLFFDEPAPKLRGEHLNDNLFNFFTEMSKKLDRQVIIIPPVDNTNLFLNKNANNIKIGK